VVTVAPRTFDDGFALQDASGGIYVARALDQAIELGSRVRVRGALAAPDKRVTVEPTSLQITGPGSAPAPIEVATGDVGPATEGRLIAVRGRVAGAIVDDRPWGSKLYVNDGSGPFAGVHRRGDAHRRDAVPRGARAAHRRVQRPVR